MKRRGCFMRTLALLGLSCAAHALWAQSSSMKDPTRPPPPFLDRAEQAQEPATFSGLQSIRRNGRQRIALLNGEWVKPGSHAGDARVERIDDQSLVLRYNDGRQEVIGLYPDVEMKSSKAVRHAAGKTGNRP